MRVLPIEPASIQEADELRVDSSGGTVCPFEVEPPAYVDDARLDLDEQTDRGNRNAIHNAKRAINCQIDWMLVNFGLVKDQKHNLPEKLERLRSLGVLSPVIINRIVRQRNLLEHDYRTGSRMDAEDSVDVAELFVHATDRWASEGGDYDIVFWHSRLRIGGTLSLARPSTDVAAGIEYRFYGSTRSDRLDPRGLLEGSAEERGYLDLGMSGSGILTHVDGEMYIAFLRCIVMAVTSPRRPSRFEKEEDEDDAT